jgi:hypothetical protein
MDGSEMQAGPSDGGCVSSAPGVSVNNLQMYYGGERYLLFYRQSGAGPQLNRDSLWIARAGQAPLELLEKQSTGARSP